MSKKEYDNGFVEGYKVGMNTAFDFVMLYCRDYKIEISSVYRVFDKGKNSKDETKKELQRIGDYLERIDKKIGGQP